jgi:MIP family channel proteins
MLRVEVEEPAGTRKRLLPSSETLIDWVLSSIVEFLATYFYVFITSLTVVASFIAANSAPNPAPFDSSRILLFAFSHGLTYSGLLLATAATGVSGGYMNPAVTLAIMVTRQMAFLKGLMFLLAQFSAAILGGFSVKWILREEYWTPQYGSLGITQIQNVSVLGALAIEFTLSFMMVFVIFSSAISPVNVGDLAPLGVGFILFGGSVCASLFTGASLNPARSLGPAVASMVFNDIWVYFLAPVSGAVLAGVFHHLVYLNRQNEKLKQQAYARLK